jgi:hypothetical protein
MTSWARPGVKCVCIDAKPRPGTEWRGDAPTLNAVYTIRSIFVGPYGGLSASFVELERSDSSKANYPGQLVGYYIERFSPLVTKTLAQDIAKFRHLLTPSPVDAGLVPAGVELDA